MKPNCYRILLAIAIALMFYAAPAGAVEFTISDLYVEAGGNNRYEAKIKANEQAMNRALLLLADKHNLPLIAEMPQVPYRELKKIFTVKKISNELVTLERYNATIDYSYKLGSLYRVLLKYGGDELQDMFSEALIIPYFRQKNKSVMWDHKDNEWYAYWRAAKPELSRHKLVLLEKTDIIAQKIRPDNISELHYEDYIRLLQDRYFKAVITLSNEFFTERDTGESIMRVEMQLHLPNNSKPEQINEELPLTEMEDIEENTQIIIDRLIDDFGKYKVSQLKEADNEKEKKEEEPKPIIMNFDAYSKDELNRALKKLGRVEEIDRFEVKHEYSSRYNLYIYTSKTEMELAEGLYENGLSFKIYGKLYTLIDIQKGS